MTAFAALRCEVSCINISITADTSAGTANKMKMLLFGQFSRINSPPSTGPTIEPMRPMPRLQPIPVERNVVG